MPDLPSPSEPSLSQDVADMPTATAPAMRRSPRWRSDCSRCCALCCVAPAFDAEQGFGFDKPAHQPCKHLRAGFLCGIHGKLSARGFAACAMFDCFGAGQRVTRLFAGRTWQSSAEAAREMFAAFQKYRALHELLALLELAICKMRPTEIAPLEDHLLVIDDLCESGAALAERVRVRELRAEVLQRIRAARQPMGDGDGSG